jgi:hypothetical protein
MHFGDEELVKPLPVIGSYADTTEIQLFNSQMIYGRARWLDPT